MNYKGFIYIAMNFSKCFLNIYVENEQKKIVCREIISLFIMHLRMYTISIERKHTCAIFRNDSTSRKNNEEEHNFESKYFRCFFEKCHRKIIIKQIIR